MEKENWKDIRYMFGGAELKPCPFCGAEPYVESCDRIINIGCEACRYHLYFHGLVQDEIETGVVASRYKDSGEACEWYDRDAFAKAAEGWNRRAQ